MLCMIQVSTTMYVHNLMNTWSPHTLPPSLLPSNSLYSLLTSTSLPPFPIPFSPLSPPPLPPLPPSLHLFLTPCRNNLKWLPVWWK